MTEETGSERLLRSFADNGAGPRIIRHIERRLDEPPTKRDFIDAIYLQSTINLKILGTVVSFLKNDGEGSTKYTDELLALLSAQSDSLTQTFEKLVDFKEGLGKGFDDGGR